jgi:hypothetical protein
MQNRAQERSLEPHQSVCASSKGWPGSLAGLAMDLAGEVYAAALARPRISWKKMSVSSLGSKILQAGEYQMKFLGGCKDSEVRIKGLSMKEAMMADSQVAELAQKRQALKDEIKGLMEKLQNAEAIFQEGKREIISKLMGQNKLAKKKVEYIDPRTMKYTDGVGALISLGGAITGWLLENPAGFVVSAAGAAFAVVCGLLNRKHDRPKALSEAQIEQRLIARMKNNELDPLEMERNVLAAELGRL